MRGYLGAELGYFSLTTTSRRSPNCCAHERAGGKLMPSRRLRVALIRRQIAASRREDPPGRRPKWLAQNARLD
jgi:hypothetical protein